MQRVGCCTTATTNAPCRLENAMHERERFARCSGDLEKEYGTAEAGEVGWPASAGLGLASQSIALGRIGCARRDGRG